MARRDDIFGGYGKIFDPYGGTPGPSPAGTPNPANPVPYIPPTAVPIPPAQMNADPFAGLNLAFNPRLEGYDYGKLMDFGHRTPKYDFGRYALDALNRGLYGPGLWSDIEGKLDPLGYGDWGLEGDRLSVLDPSDAWEGVTNFDLFRDFNPDDPAQGAIQWLALTGGGGGAPGAPPNQPGPQTNATPAQLPAYIHPDRPIESDMVEIMAQYGHTPLSQEDWAQWVKDLATGRTDLENFEREVALAMSQPGAVQYDWGAVLGGGQPPPGPGPSSPAPGPAPSPAPSGSDGQSDLLDDAIEQLLQGTPFRRAIQQQLLDALQGEGYPQEAVDRRLVNARESMAGAEQAQLADARAALAERGLISVPGVAQGPEGLAIERIAEGLAPAYAQEVSEIESQAMEEELANHRELMAIAAGVSASEADSILRAVGEGTDRQRLFATIALEHLSQERQWNQFLAQLGLDREALMYQIQQGQISQLIQLIELYLKGADISAAGYIGKD